MDYQDIREQDFHRHMRELLRIQPYLARQANPYNGAPLARPVVNIDVYPSITIPTIQPR